MQDDWRGRRVTVMGLGHFGGGAGVTRWLAEQGAEVLVTDRATATELARSLTGIDDLVAAGAVRLRLGGHDPADFAGADLVVASPAVARPWDDPYLGAAVRAGVPITTEIRLLVDRLDRRRVIGVTGTAGKSTTAAMIHHVLSVACPGTTAHLGGNIGGSLLGAVDRIAPDDWIVLELSSFMLHWLGDYSPRIALLTNLAPNHLDWHGSFAHYAAAKDTIFRHQQAGDHALRGAELPTANEPFDLRIPGPHNQRNAALAATAARCAGVTRADARAALASFAGLPHRLELVGEWGGRCFVNDSKSTTPEATVLAVASFPRPGRVHLIAGGHDKGSDLRPIAALADRLAGLYTIGRTGAGLARLARASGRAFPCRTLDRAVAHALDRMDAGDVLLLSPGCASWDQFDHYEARGDAFRAAVDRARVPAPAGQS